MNSDAPEFLAGARGRGGERCSAEGAASCLSLCGGGDVAGRLSGLAGACTAIAPVAVLPGVDGSGLGGGAGFCTTGTLLTTTRLPEEPALALGVDEPAAEEEEGAGGGFALAVWEMILCA